LSNSRWTQMGKEEVRTACTYSRDIWHAFFAFFFFHQSSVSLNLLLSKKFAFISYTHLLGLEALIHIYILSLFCRFLSRFLICRLFSFPLMTHAIPSAQSDFFSLWLFFFFKRTPGHSPRLISAQVLPLAQGLPRAPLIWGVVLVPVSILCQPLS
jgi:hypothetical protein